MERDGLDLQIRCRKQMLCLLYALFSDVFRNRLIGFLFEDRRKIPRADVYVGGKKLAHHDGGYSTWRVNITEELTDSTEIAVIVDNAPNEIV